MTPFLSVIIPVYNAEKYLNQCVDSIIQQTYKAFEIILVNDGSTDGSGKICDDYQARFPFVTVIHKKNGGTTTARREGLAIARGSFVSFIDSDDWVEPTMYACLTEKVIHTDAEAVLCDIIYEDGSAKLQPNFVKEGFWSKEDLLKEVYPNMLFDFEQGCPGINPSLCNKIFKRELLVEAIQTVNEEIFFGEDALCTYPALLRANSIYVTHEKFYHYRQNGESVSNRYDPTLLCKFILLEKEFKKQFSYCGYDASAQLSGYVARLSLECIRSELLFNKEAPLRRRMHTVKEYVEHPTIRQAFLYSVQKIGDSKVEMKMKLIIKRRLYCLYLMFYFKNIVLLIRKKKQ